MVKISVKLLKGEQFDIEADETEKVIDLKLKIEQLHSDLKADRQKLIHAGKILKDDSSVSELGIKESDFLVCMATKEVSKPKPAQLTPPILPTTNIAPAPAPSSIESATPVESSANNFVTPDALNALLSMGFPENESKAALQAALGNPDLAYEYLLQGIPAQASNSQSFANVSANASTSIQQLRAHPQFNMLKQLIQSNPSSLPQVLNLIGQQNPSLLEAIHQNERDFLAMMNEPIGANSQPPAVSALPQSPGGQPNPAQIIQALSSLPESQRAQFAQSIGISPDQLGAFMQTLAQLPPGQLEQMMGSGGQPQAGQTTIALTHDEMEAINRLMSLGFSQQQAVQAFIACDRNETLAANFLFESGDDYDEGQEFEGMDGHEDDHN